MLSYPARCRWVDICAVVCCLFVDAFVSCEVPLAPQKVLTQYGLQGVTTRDGLVAFLTRSTNQRSDGDYALGLYVMLSRARQLDDLFLVDLPEREVVESLLTSANPTLVQRMRDFEQRAEESAKVAQRIARSLGWPL